MEAAAQGHELGSVCAIVDTRLFTQRILHEKKAINNANNRTLEAALTWR